jgi:ABC-type transport system involved in cytochrome bd biosynthesis fused ATPase/permease subunit
MNQLIKVNMNRLFAEAGSLTMTEGWVTFAFMFYILLYWCSKFVEINLVKDSSGSTFVLVWFWVMMQVFPGLIFGYNEMCEKMHSIDCIKNFILDENLEGEFAIHTNFSECEDHGEITYNAVNVRYEKIDDRALSNVSFKVRGGEKVAIIGRSGSGKSTL